MAENPIKLIWHSNAPHAPTGYGNQTALFTPKLAEHYDLRISNFYGLEADFIHWNGIKIMPCAGGTFGLESLPYHAKQFFGEPRGGLIVTLMDVWVLDPAVCSQFNMVCWTPVDHEPPPPRVMNFFRQSNAVPVAMTENGRQQLQEFDPLYCPHAVDTNVMRPLGREMARQKLGIPQDAFVIGMVAANKGNPSRKSFVAVLEAFAEIRRRHDNVLLYLHTDVSGQFAGGVPLLPVMQALDLPAESVRFVEQYRVYFEPISQQTMPLVYSALDVLANPSTGEGFGIPMLEAQACGLPVIGSDFTAMRELVGAGWKVSGARQWTPQESWQILPRVKDIVRALEQCYRMKPEQRRRLSDRARAFALRYDLDRVVSEHMLPSLLAAEDRLRRREPVIVPARAA